MDNPKLSAASTTEGLPISPSLGPALAQALVPPHETILDRRSLFICALCVGLALAAAFLAELLIHLIALITNLSFYGRLSAEAASPAGNTLGWWVVLVPVAGALLVGLMARYGSKAIRGHGIPEAMEQVLTNQSRIPPRVTWLKPVSAAISIGTGGPFGAEGPIIASGGALGSLIGQLLKTTADERKILLAAGAAAGMAATFGSPVAAVLLAIELLLFEYRPRSLVPVALACATAAGMRVVLEGGAPVFAMPDVASASGAAQITYILIGALIGLAAVAATRLVYGIEDAFEHLPLHWMWWPAVGAVAVGLVGAFAPRTMGVGYDNITAILANKFTLPALGFLCAMKFLSWSISLGSGTSGGTLAPLFTIGGGIGAVLGAAAAQLAPAAGIDLRVAALVGMAALFAGASRALLASVVFAFETTHQTMGLLPLLGGCTASYCVSCLLMKQTIMTEKIARRGIFVPGEYAADALAQIPVKQVASPNVVSLKAADSLETVRAWLASGATGTSHQGFPVLNEKGHLAGVLTRRDLLNLAEPGTRPIVELIRRPPVVVYDDLNLRSALDHMVNHDVGRLPVISRADPSKIVGMISRSDVLSAFRRRVQDGRDAQQGIPLKALAGSR
ncbi:MAG: chloride channel protein [Planctomycetes bacterium]|nr:chloride channel protein [Planctomycetota bacterium]